MVLSKDSEASDAHAPDAMVEEVFHEVFGLQVTMYNSFIEQVVSEYMSKISPWPLNYTCGGPDFLNLFSNWKADAKAGRDADRNLWRRVHNEAVLSPGKCTQILAARPEIQLSADWMLVPAARNLHWKFQVLHNAFTVVKMRASKDTDHHNHLIQMLKPMQMIWPKIESNAVIIDVTRSTSMLSIAHSV